MNLIGKYKLVEFLRNNPQIEPAIAAWIKDQAQGFWEKPPFNEISQPFWGGNIPFGKFHVNYHCIP